MNILAHLHLASLANSSIIGNAGADFVKGDPYQQYSSVIADGIMMHRRVDALIDHWPEVKQAKQLFIKPHQRVAPITLDIVWDHFLSKHWSRYHDMETVAEFNLKMKTVIVTEIALFPLEFQDFMMHMWQDNWLINYSDINYIRGTLNGMANRRPKLIALKSTFSDIENNYQSLEQTFYSFYPQLIALAQQQQL